MAFMSSKIKYKTQFDKMTQKPVTPLVIELGIPTTISMLVTNLYNMVDTKFVGLIDTSASGAVGIVFAFMAILQAFGFMFGQGAGSIISRRLGAKDIDSATETASTSFFIAFFSGIIIALLGFIFMDPLIYMLGSTDTILPYAKKYLNFIMLAAPFSVSTFVLNNVLRYEGRASLAMLGLVSGAIINIVCDPILMFGLNLGIAGAGISTAISQLISFAILIYMFLSGKTQSKISLKRFTKNIPLILDIMGTGLPSLMRQALTSVSTMLLNQQARVYGDAAVAGMSIVTKITMFIFAVGLGLGQGFQPVCGFNYGAGIYSRVKKAFKSTFILAEIMLGIMAVIGLCLSNQAIGLFRNDPDVIAFGTPALKFQCAGLFLQPMVVLSNMTLQSSGQKFRATLLSMLRSGIYFIPSLYLMAALFGAAGIQATQTVADVLSFSTSVPFIAYYLIHLPKDRKNQEYV